MSAMADNQWDELETKEESSFVTSKSTRGSSGSQPVKVKIVRSTAPERDLDQESKGSDSARSDATEEENEDPSNSQAAHRSPTSSSQPQSQAKGKDPARRADSKPLAANTVARKRTRPSKKGDGVTVNLSQCMYEVVRRCATERSWKYDETEEDLNEFAQCNLYWIDKGTIQEHFKRIQGWEKVNHIPGMPHIARKAKLSRTLSRMRKRFPEDYDFTPKTWVLPTDLPAFKEQFDANGKSSSIFIIKPDAKCQGKGIYMVRDLEEVNLSEVCVAQKYLKNPLLINGFKFDLRVYLLVTSCYPLRAYIFNDGLVRMCTNPYTAPNAKNLEDRCMHLTNYAVNKKNDKFEYNKDALEDGQGSKRSLRWFFKWIASEHGQEASDTLWAKIEDVLLKALIAVQPTLTSEYCNHWRRPGSVTATPSSSSSSTTEEREKERRELSGLSDSDLSDDESGAQLKKGREKKATDEQEEQEEEEELSPWRNNAFAILGTDVIIDQNLKPMLLEVNMLPSFNSDSPLDLDIKRRLIAQALDLLDINPSDKRVFSQRHASKIKQRLYASSAAEKEGQKSSVKPNKERKEEKSWEEILGDFYAKYLPGKKQDTSKLLQKYAGREGEMMSFLRLKYKKQIDTFDLVEKFYFEFRPNKMDRIPQLMEKYRDREDELIQKLEKKFDSSADDLRHINLSTIRSIEKVLEESSPYHDGLEEGKLKDYLRLYPPTDEEKLRYYNKLLAYSNDSLDEEKSRLLGGRRASQDDQALMDGSGAVGFLPAIGKRNGGGGGSEKAGQGEWKAPPEPSAVTVAKLTRMMNGLSSKSAPSSLESIPLAEMQPPQKPERERDDNISYGLKMRLRKSNNRLPAIPIAKVNLGGDFPF